MSGTVVVTGASSFVGCHLATAFRHAGWRVVATHSRPLRDYDSLRHQRLMACGELHRLDLADGEAVAALVQRERPALWLHHAGYASGYASPDFPLLESLAVNAAPLAPLYAALRGTGCGVIVTGSSMEYAAADHPNREDEACWPDTPYGLSKLTETLAARQLALRHSVSTRVARLYIPFGPQDHPGKLLPQVVSALRQGQAVELSAGLQRRDFLGISDLCRGYLALAADLPRTVFDIFNIASGQPMALRGMLTMIAERLSADPALLRFGVLPMRPGEAELSAASVAKAERLLDWRPSPLDLAIDCDLLGKTDHG